MEESRGLGEAGRCEGREASKREEAGEKEEARGEARRMSSAWQALLKGTHAVERDLVTGDDVTALAEIGQGKWQRNRLHSQQELSRAVRRNRERA